MRGCNVENDRLKGAVEAILFASGRVVEIKELMIMFGLPYEDIDNMLQSMKAELEHQERGMELIKIGNGYQLCTKKEYYEYIYPIFDNRNRPNLSNAGLETLSIIAYNPRITRSEIEQIRGVNSDSSLYRLLEYGLIEEAGKLDMPRQTDVI